MLPNHIRQAIYDYIPHMEGWTTPERGCEMADRILETKAEVCIDIGVFGGRSTIAQAFAVREQGAGMVYGIDPWAVAACIEGDSPPENTEWWKEKAMLEEMHQKTMHAIWDHKLEPWVTVIRNASQYVAQLFPVIDFLNIDGQHSEVASCRDVRLYVPSLLSGHYLTFDDTDWASTQPALRLVEQSCELVSDTGKARTYRKL